MNIENQLDPKWSKWYLGKAKGSSFKNFGCFLFCWTYLYSVAQKRQVSPSYVDVLFTKNGVYVGKNGDLIDSTKAAKVLGMRYIGKETNVNKPPSWYPNIKRVDFSIADGRQYHFVVRDLENGKKIIKDPFGGVTREINFYEKKVNDLGWKKGVFEYRLIK